MRVVLGFVRANLYRGGGGITPDHARKGEKEMSDLYTKTALTIIALALMGLSAQNAVSPASAQGSGCGQLSFDPCYVNVVNTVDIFGHVTTN